MQHVSDGLYVQQPSTLVRWPLHFIPQLETQCLIISAIEVLVQSIGSPVSLRTAKLGIREAKELDIAVPVDLAVKDT